MSSSRDNAPNPRRIYAVAICILVFVASCLALAADQAAAFAQRRTAAEAASGGHRAKLFVDLARDEMEASDRAYTAGDVENGLKLAEASAADAQTCSDAAIASGKRLKDTEIDLRKLQTRTRDIARSLNFDDRPAVEKIVERLEQMRQTLLDRMFGDEKKKKTP